MADSIPETALFVCFGGMSNVGIMTGLASIEAMKQVKPGKAGIFCLAGLPTHSAGVLSVTQAVKRIVTGERSSIKFLNRNALFSLFASIKYLNR